MGQRPEWQKIVACQQMGMSATLNGGSLGSGYVGAWWPEVSSHWVLTSLTTLGPLHRAGTRLPQDPVTPHELANVLPLKGGGSHL